MKTKGMSGNETIKTVSAWKSFQELLMKVPKYDCQGSWEQAIFSLSLYLFHFNAHTRSYTHAFTQTQCSFELTHSHSPFLFTHSFSPSLFLLLLLLLACIHAQPFPSSSVTSFTEAKAPLPPLFYPHTRTHTHACTANHTHPHVSTHISNTHLYTRTLSHTLACKHSHIYSVALSYPAILFVFFPPPFIISQCVQFYWQSVLRESLSVLGKSIAWPSKRASGRSPCDRLR